MYLLHYNKHYYCISSSIYCPGKTESNRSNRWYPGCEESFKESHQVTLNKLASSLLIYTSYTSLFLVKCLNLFIGLFWILTTNWCQQTFSGLCWVVLDGWGQACMLFTGVFIYMFVPLLVNQKKKLTLLGWGSAFGFTIWVPGGIMPLGGSLTSTSKPASKWKDHLQFIIIKDGGL